MLLHGGRWASSALLKQRTTTPKNCHEHFSKYFQRWWHLTSGGHYMGLYLRNDIGGIFKYGLRITFQDLYSYALPTELSGHDPICPEEKKIGECYFWDNGLIKLSCEWLLTACQFWSCQSCEAGVLLQVDIVFVYHLHSLAIDLRF